MPQHTADTHRSNRNHTRATTARRTPAGVQESLDVDIPKRCTECGVTKPVDEFSPNQWKRSKLQSYCRSCALRRRRLERGVHPDDAGLKPDLDQTCEICSSDGGARGLFLDHDHETGRFRGWLCGRCNSAIGHLRDNLLNARAAVDYLQRTARP